MLWPPPTVRFAAIGRLRGAEPLVIATCKSAAASSVGGSYSLSDGRLHEAAAEGASEEERLLWRVMRSEKIREHPKLTVSTDGIGMLHYELGVAHGNSRLLFLAVTQADYPRSEAFEFLRTMREEFTRAFADPIRHGRLEGLTPRAAALLAQLSMERNAAHGASDASPAAQALTADGRHYLHDALALELSAGAAAAEAASAGAASALTAMPGGSPGSSPDARIVGHHAAMPGAMPSSSPRSSPAPEGDFDSVTLAEVRADLARQIDAVRALYDVSRGAALWLLRRHGWHHSHVVRALEEESSLREQLGLLSPRPSALDDEEGTTEELVTPPAEEPRTPPTPATDELPAAAGRRRRRRRAPAEAPAAALSPTSSESNVGGGRRRAPSAALRHGGRVPLCAGVGRASSLMRCGAVLPAELHEAYDEAVVRCYLAEALSWRKCPAPGCELAVCCLSALPVGGTRPALDAVCRCGHRFCWACGREAHRPLRCEMIASWCDLCAQLDDDLATAAAGAAAVRLRAYRAAVARLPDAEAELRAALAESRAVFDACFAKGGDPPRRPLPASRRDARRPPPSASRRSSSTRSPPRPPPTPTTRRAVCRPTRRSSPNGCRSSRGGSIFSAAASPPCSSCRRSRSPGRDEGGAPSADVPHVRRLSSADLDVADDGDGNAAVLPRIGGERALALLAHAKLVSSRLEPLSLLAQAADEKTREVRATIDQLVALTPAIGSPAAAAPAVEVEKEEEGLAGLAAGVGRKLSTLFGGAPM